MGEYTSPETFFAKHGTTEYFAPRSKNTQAAPEKNDDAQASARQETKIEAKLVFPTSLRGKPLPEAEWIADGWLPIGDVTLLYGDGGVGKTLLAQQLMACAAIGAPWCSLPVRKCKSIGLFCEDDDAELHRRQDAIQHHLGTDFYDERMDAMAWWSRKGEDNLLATFDQTGRMRITALYDAILDAARTMDARLIVLDTAADLFAGNENDRGQVRQFIGALARLAMMCRSAVILNCHPSRAGLAAGGSMDSGSTGWSNTARSRLSLERLRADGDGPVDTDARTLAKRKSNRSSIGEVIPLRWREGVLAPVAPASCTGAGPAQADVEDAFLALLAQAEAEGRYVSATVNASNFAPKAFAARADARGYTKADLARAMERLFTSGRIVNAAYGRANDRGRPRRIMACGTAPDG
jgi:RecA-family ATPase